LFFMAFIGGGFSIWVLNACISIGLMMACFLLFAGLRIKAISTSQSGSRKLGAKKFWFFLALVGYATLITQFIPWALFWLWAVWRNPD
jgi:hypothetical protein